MMRLNPLVYVLISVAKFATSTSGEYSSTLGSSRVRKSEPSRSAQNLRGFASIFTCLYRSTRKPKGVSLTCNKKKEEFIF